MIKRIRNLGTRAWQTDLVKVFSFTALSTSVKMITALVSTKIVALIIGPVGVALLGQLSNFVTIVLSIASAGLNNGITKYIAEYRSSSSKVRMLLSTAFRLVLYCSVVVSIVMIVFNKTLSRIVLLSANYGYIFVIFGLTVIFYAINNLLMATVNGFKQFKLYTYINIAGSIFGLLFSVAFVLTMSLSGALIAIVTYQSVVLIVSVWLLRKQLWFKIKNFLLPIDRSTLRLYMKYSIGTLVFIIATPLIQLLLRGYVIADLSQAQAGVWEGMNRISAMYMMVVNMSLAVYYIPRLSELHTAQEIRCEIIKAYRFLLPVLLVGFGGVYLLRRFIIWLLYTPEFYGMEALFPWQLSLDLINACSFVISYLLIAKAMMFEYTLITLIFSGIYLAMSYLLLHLQQNVVGIIQGNIISQIFYFVTLLYIFRKTLFKRNYATT